MRGIYCWSRLLLRASNRYRSILQVFVFLSAGLGYCFLLGSYALSRHHAMARTRNISVTNPSVQVKVVYSRDQIACWLLAHKEAGWSEVKECTHTHWDTALCSKRAQWMKLWMCCWQSKCFWKRCNTVWLLRGEPSSDLSVPAAAMYCVRELSWQVIWSVQCLDAWND
jgi:hypothetical protein